MEGLSAQRQPCCRPMHREQHGHKRGKHHRLDRRYQDRPRPERNGLARPGTPCKNSWRRRPSGRRKSTRRCRSRKPRGVSARQLSCSGWRGTTVKRRPAAVRMTLKVTPPTKTPAGTSRGLPHQLLTDFRRRWLFGFRRSKRLIFAYLVSPMFWLRARKGSRACMVSCTCGPSIIYVARAPGKPGRDAFSPRLDSGRQLPVQVPGLHALGFPDVEEVVGPVAVPVFGFFRENG